MKVLNLGVVVAIPALLFAQDPIAAGDGTHSNTTTRTVASSSDSSQSSATPATLEPLTPEQKVKRRALRLIEPVTLASLAVGAGIEQCRNVPPEWGQGSGGFARRFASDEGFAAAHNAVGLGFDLAFHLDPRYRPMPQARFGPRMWNAISQTFVAYKDSGGRTINVSEIGGNFAAGFISNTWQPKGYDSTGDALMRGALGIACHTARNIAREFLPDLLHPRRH
jgi:hypothetical protein